MTDSEPQNTHDDLLGRQLSQFTVIEEVGRGGMATVYRATQQSINRDVALKVLPRTFLHDPNFIERFSREVEVIAHLEHPHIVPIYDYGQAEGMPYIAMRYLAGGSLRRMIREGVSDLRELIRPVSQLAQALDHAHAQGIIHRDLKPGNVLLDTANNAYLSDFGIARVLNSDLTGSAIIGTPSYMSPEQANGYELDPRSDVYALGIVAFELITGREPFQAATPMAMLLKQINEPVPSLLEYRRNLPELLDLVIATATAKDRDARYKSAGEMAEAFEEAVRSIGTGVGVPNVVQGEDDLPPTEPMDVEGRVAVPYSTPTDDLDGMTVTPATNDITRDRVLQAQRDTDGPATMATPPPINPNLAKKQEPKSRNMWAYSAIGIAALLVAAVGFAVLNTVVGTPALSESVPLYAQGVQVVDNEMYALGIPAGFSPSATGDGATWQNADGTLAVSVQALPMNGAGFAGASVAYMDAYDDLDLIDTSGSNAYQRFSLRQPGTAERQRGQTDIYMATSGDNLLVIQLYSADTAPADSVETLQAVLDSVRVPAG